MIRLTVFVSACLLFLVQPMVGRHVVPLLGGSAQTWNTCMVFFQLTLLAGYLYAHLLVRGLGASASVPVHALVALAACGALPLVAPPPAGPPPGGSPVPWLLAYLARSVGPCFFVLAASTPLVQRWLAGSNREGAGDPYFLFAASNLGSMLALVLYPLGIEPFLGLADQRTLFTRGYGLFLLLLLGVGLHLWRHRRTTAPTAVGLAEAARRAGTPGGPARWLALSFVPSSLLLGVTAHMANEVPSLPLLWVVPLLLYLLSFALVFARRPPLPHGFLVAVHPLAITLLALVLFVPTRVSGFSLHLGAFFVMAMVLHGELARSRPPPEALTSYYLWISAGGALGGVFNALLAPALFPVVAELPLALLAAAVLHPYPADEGAGPWTRPLDWLAPGLLGALTLGVMFLLPNLGDFRDTLVRVSLLFLAAMVAHWFRARRLRFVLSLLVVMAAGFVGLRYAGTLALARSYHGTYQVRRDPASGNLLLHHGTTVQGSQAGEGEEARPSSYYHPDTPVGLLLRERAPSRARIGAIGLGVGALAWYGKPGQELRFYEIDPLVRDLASDPEHFSFLSRAPGRVEVVIGDGRLRIAAEPDGSLDMVLLDAFSSDAIPVHLLTREALEIYLRKLAPGGVVLLHITNRHLRLERVVGALVRELRVPARLCLPDSLSKEESAKDVALTHWAILARREEDLRRWTGSDPCWAEPIEDPSAPVWTDDFTSLVSVLRW